MRARAVDHDHHGATSQDILDTATMLVAHRALGPLLAGAAAAAHQRAQRPGLLHTAVHAGVPAANAAYAVAQRVLDEDELRPG